MQTVGRCSVRIGQKLRMVRKAQGRTLEDVADLADIHLVTLGQYERGSRPAPWDTVRALSAIYGMEPEEFLADEPWRTIDDAQASVVAALAELGARSRAPQTSDAGASRKALIRDTNVTPPAGPESQTAVFRPTQVAVLI
jgi:transcriptional regulator with XRE-family HTH domain